MIFKNDLQFDCILGAFITNKISKILHFET